MSSIPGQLVNTWQFSPSPNNGCRIPVRSRGHGSYILVISQPIDSPRLLWQFRGRSGLGTQFQRSGRPRANMLVWHLDRDKVADSFVLEFYVKSVRQPGARVPVITCQLYCAPMGSPWPRGPGWQPEDIGRHIH